MMEHNQQRHNLLLQEYDDYTNNSSITNNGSSISMDNVAVVQPAGTMLYHNNGQPQQTLDANYYHQQKAFSNNHPGSFSDSTSSTTSSSLASTLSEFSANYQEKEQEQQQLSQGIIPFNHWNVYKLTVGLLFYRFPKLDLSQSSSSLNNNTNNNDINDNTKQPQLPQQQSKRSSWFHSDHHTLENDYSDPLLVIDNNDNNSNDNEITIVNNTATTSTTTTTINTSNNVNDHFVETTSFLRGFFYYMTIESMNSYGCCCCFKCLACTAGYHNAISRLYYPITLLIVTCLVPLSNTGLTIIEQFFASTITKTNDTGTSRENDVDANDVDTSSIYTIQAVLIALVSYITLFGIAALVQGTIEMYAHYYNDDDITTLPSIPTSTAVVQGQQQKQQNISSNNISYTVLGWWYDCTVTVCYEKFIMLSGLYIIIVLSLIGIGYIGEQIIYFCIQHPKLLSLVDTTSWFQTIIDIPLIVLLLYISSITISIIVPCLLIECCTSSSTPTNTVTGATSTTNSSTVLPTTTIKTNTISLSTTSKTFQQNLQYYLLSIISCTIIRNIIYYPIWSIYRCYQLTKNYRTIMFLYCFILSVVWVLSEYSIYLIRTYIVATLIELFSTTNPIDLYDKYYDHISHPTGTPGSTYYSDILQVIDVILFYLPSLFFIPFCAVLQTIVYLQLRSNYEYGYYTKQQMHIELNQHTVYFNSSNFISTDDSDNSNNNNNNNDNNNKSCSISSKVLSPLLLVIPSTSSSTSSSNSRQQQQSYNKNPFTQRQRQRQRQQQYNYSHINGDDEFLDFEYDPPNVTINYSNNNVVVEKFELGFGL